MTIFFKYTKSTKGEHLDAGYWYHSCSFNDHIINGYKSPASDCNFLSKYLLLYVKNGITSQIKLQQVLIADLGCIGRGLSLASQTLQYNEENGYNLLQSYSTKIKNEGGYSNIETVRYIPNSDASESIMNELESRRGFVRLFVSVKEQINVGSEICSH